MDSVLSVTKLECTAVHLLVVHQRCCASTLESSRISIAAQFEYDTSMQVDLLPLLDICKGGESKNGRCSTDPTKNGRVRKVCFANPRVCLHTNAVCQ